MSNTVDHRNRLTSKEKAEIAATQGVSGDPDGHPRMEALFAVVERILSEHPPDRAFQLIRQGIRREQVPAGSPPHRRGFERGLETACAVVEHVRDTWAEGGRS